MGYVLEAVIGPEAVIRTVARELTPLPQGMAMMPMTDEVFDAVAADPSADRDLGFWKLPVGYEGKMAAWSAAGPVGYLEAKYFGGTGSQRVALWVHGEMTFGPLRSENGDPFPPEGSPISQLLRKLGVTRGTHDDEFDALGLGSRRSTEDWPIAG